MIHFISVIHYPNFHHLRWFLSFRPSLSSPNSTTPPDVATLPLLTQPHNSTRRHCSPSPRPTPQLYQTSPPLPLLTQPHNSTIRHHPSLSLPNPTTLPDVITAPSTPPTHPTTLPNVTTLPLLVQPHNFSTRHRSLSSLTPVLISASSTPRSVLLNTEEPSSLWTFPRLPSSTDHVTFLSFGTTEVRVQVNGGQ